MTRNAVILNGAKADFKTHLEKRLFAPSQASQTEVRQ